MEWWGPQAGILPPSILGASPGLPCGPPLATMTGREGKSAPSKLMVQKKGTLWCFYTAVFILP